jgi:N utilization substance protein A
MRSELVLAVNQLCAERKLSPDIVMEAIEASLISAYKRNFGAAGNVEVRIEPDTGEVRVFAAKEVVEEAADRKLEITLEEARAVEPQVQLGDTVFIESTPKDFGRIAAQTAKQVILQRIREAEREALYSSFADSAGEIAHGTIQSVDFHSNDVIVSIEGTEALLPAREQVPTERYRRNQRLRAYVMDVRKGSRGPQITLSRRSPALLRRLLELEVPEIFNGSVEIKGIAREAGSRSKVAVHATQEGVDPVGSCVGVRGGRIQNVVNELGGEKIDVVQWHPDMGTFIANSLSPAKVMNVILENGADTSKTATVIVPDRQLSLAIGKEGQNARLAAKLTGWRIDIKSATEAAEETMGRLEDIRIAPEDMDLLDRAEFILREQGEHGLSKEQKEVVDAVLGEREIETMPFERGSAAEMAAETEPDAEVAVELEAGAEPVDAEAGPAVGDEELLGAEGEEAIEDELGSALPDRLAILEEEEQVPTFDGEPIKDSIGWVPVAPAEDYYSGWSDEEEEKEPEFEWVRDEVFEAEQPSEYRRPTGKKKAKKRPAHPVRDVDQPEYGGGLRDRKGDRPRGR